MLKKRALKIIRNTGIILFALISISATDLYEITGFDFLKDVFLTLSNLEDKFYDVRNDSNISARKPRSKSVFLIQIDDYSLKKIGMWPFPRSYYADLLDQLAKYDVKTVAFDVLFPEKSPSYSGQNPDLVFEKAIERFTAQDRFVILSYSTVPLRITENNEVESASEEDFFDEFPDDLFLNTVNSKVNKEGELSLTGISNTTYPIRPFIDAGSNLGFISSVEDKDGFHRRYRVIANPFPPGAIIDSLALITYLQWSGAKNIFAESFKTKSGIIRPGLAFPDGNFLELNRSGDTKIRYFGAENAFESFSLYDVLHPTPKLKEELKKLAGAVVFVGSTAVGAHDLRPTPVSPKMPGVYAHMNMTEMLHKRYFFQESASSIIISSVLLLLAMGLFFFLHRFENAIYDLLALLLVLSSFWYIDVVYFLPAGYELKLATIYICLSVIYLWNTFLNFYEANKEKRQIKGTFARYVAPTVVDEILKDPENIQVGGTKRDITCLFSDVRDFTSISEGLSAQELANMLNDYMNKMTDIVFETRGTLDKYIGDAIVAIWGAPIEIGNHAQFAVEAAVRMTEAMPAINEDFQKRGLPFFNVGIGLNTGECSVGNMGSSRIFSYTALGDNMNLGARLEGLCKFYGTQILISDETRNRIDKQLFKTRPIDKVVVKGRTQAVQIHEVISRAHPMNSLAQAHQFYLTGYELFEQKNFKGALEVFEQILSFIDNDKPTKRLKALCEKFLADPTLVTDDFDVTKMTEK